MIPNQIYAGTKVDFTYTLSNTPSQGWTSSIVLRDNADFMEQITATTEGDTYRIQVSSVDTATWAIGTIKLYIYATKDGENSICSEQEICIKPNPLGASHKTPLMLELEAVTKAIAGVLAGEGIQQYTFETAHGQRSATKMNLLELRQHRSYLEAKIENECASQNGKKSRHGWRKIQTKWSC